MEKNIIPIIIVLILVGHIPAMSDVVEGFGAGIQQSPHNFSHPAWHSLAKICHVCHIVHDETFPNQRYPEGLLWNGSVDSVSYNLYHSNWGAAFFETRDKTSWSSLTGKRSNLPDGLSKLCLACHDGIIAPDVFVLHHFVSAEYDMTKTNLREPDITIMGMSGSITEILDSGKIQCTSCHDVHGVESVANTKLLRAEKYELCTICHKVNIKE